MLLNIHILVVFRRNDGKPPIIRGIIWHEPAFAAEPISFSIVEEPLPYHFLNSSRVNLNPMSWMSELRKLAKRPIEK